MTRRECIALVPTVILKAAEVQFDRIDCHMHLNRTATRFVSGMERTGWRALSICVSRAVEDEPNDVDEQRRGTSELHRQSNGRIAWATSFDARFFESRDFAQRTIAGLERDFKDGAIGVKIWKNIGMAIRSKSGAYLMPDDRALLPIYEAIQKADRTLVAHLAEPAGAWMPLDDKNPEVRYYSSNPQWHMYNKPDAPDKQAILSARDRIAERYPKLRVVGCHLGSNEDDLRQVAERLDRLPNLAVDLAARVRYFASGDRTTAREFILKYQDRIVYGSDFRLRDSDDGQAWKSANGQQERDWSFLSGSGLMSYGKSEVQALALPHDVLRKIFYSNPKRWFPGIT